MNRTASDYAADYNLFCEYIDTGAIMFIDSADFYETPIEEREALAQQVIDANA